MTSVPVLLAPDGLLAIFKGKDGVTLSDPVFAFDANGYAMTLDKKAGRLVSVREDPAFLHLES